MTFSPWQKWIFLRSMITYDKWYKVVYFTLPVSQHEKQERLCSSVMTLFQHKKKALYSTKQRMTEKITLERLQFDGHRQNLGWYESMIHVNWYVMFSWVCGQHEYEHWPVKQVDIFFLCNMCCSICHHPNTLLIFCIVEKNYLQVQSCISMVNAATFLFLLNHLLNHLAMLVYKTKPIKLSTRNIPQEIWT